VTALSNKHVVLGLLIERAAYAYDIEQRFNTRFRFLSLSDKVVYKLIRQLEDEGWIERAGIKKAGGMSSAGGSPSRAKSALPARRFTSRSFSRSHQTGRALSS
jgi:hypothetical protein